MKNVLFVDCCIRREASNTKKLAEAFLSALPSDCAVTRLDLMAEDIVGGKSVQLGEFGIFRPTIKAKSADTAEGVTASNIVRKRIVFTPGKIFQRTLGEMSVTRSIPVDTDYTDGSSSGGNGSGGNQGGGNQGGDGGLDENPLG